MNQQYIEYMDRYIDKKFVYVSNGEQIAVCEFLTKTIVEKNDTIVEKNDTIVDDEYARHKCSNLLVMDIVDKLNVSNMPTEFKYNDIIYKKDMIMEDDELYFYKRHEPAFAESNHFTIHDGLFTQWHHNGKKRYTYNSKEGKYHGLYTRWYENGKIQSEWNYKEMSPHGLCTKWDENGKKLYEYNYDNGIKID